MRRVFLALFSIALIALFWQLIQLYLQYQQLEAKTALITQKTQKIKGENAALLADLQYLTNPENLLKELRSRFSYKKPGEQVIIIVPQKIDE